MNKKQQFRIEDCASFVKRHFKPDEKIRKRVFFDSEIGWIRIHTKYPTTSHTYDIEISRMNHPGQILDFILQINRKPWCDGELIKELLEVFEEACRESFGICAQGIFCPNGKSQKRNWPKFPQ